MKKLIWDSEFWGVEVYNAENLEDIDIDTDKKYFVQILLDRDKILNNSQLNSELQLIETKINLLKEVYETNKIEINSFGKIKEDELIEYKEEFYNLFGQNSRFRIFPKQKVNDFYYMWLINSIREEYDSNVIGFYINNKLAGFITYKYVLDCIQIGLVGVFKKFQRQGISSQLIKYVENQTLEKNFSKIRISTNSFNLPALNTYIKNGFIIEDIKYWYYMYNKE